VPFIPAMPIPGLVHHTPRRHGDHRGFFAETYSQRAYAALGVDATFVQDNNSVSAAVGTVRGLHFQAPPAAPAKLVRCGRGAIFDVAVDIRRGSPDEVAFEMGWISKPQLQARAQQFGKNTYGAYLATLAR